MTDMYRSTKKGDHVLGHLSHEILSVAFFYLEHNVCITGHVHKSIRCEVKWQNEG